MVRFLLYGKPNVGKSSLYNALIRRNQAIVSSKAHATRDIREGVVRSPYEKEKDYMLFDAGGISSEKRELIREAKEQVVQALDRSHFVLFIVAAEFINDQDRDLLKSLRRSQKPFITIVNQCDRDKEQNYISELRALGIESFVATSCRDKIGIERLRDEIQLAMQALKESGFTDEEKPETRRFDFSFCLVGRPNVGKSSLLNKLLGQYRAIVSEVSGTTRDAISEMFHYKDLKIKIVDTAGLRKKNKQRDDIEALSEAKSISNIQSAEIVVLLADAIEGVGEQEKKLIALAQRYKRAVIVLINKWDKVQGEWKDYRDYLDDQIPYLKHVSVFPVSAKTGHNVNMLLDEIVKHYELMTREIPTREINRIIEEAVRKKSPPAQGTGRLKIYYGLQVKTFPPTIRLFVNRSSLLVNHYKKYLENQFRKAFPMAGHALILTFSDKKNSKEKKND